VPRQRTAAVTEHYKPKLVAALQTNDAKQIYPVLRATVIAAWLAAVHKAASKAPAIATAVQTNGLDLAVPPQTPIDWAESADIPGDALPSGLAIQLAAMADYAENLASGDSDLDPDDQADQIIRTTANEMAETAAQAAYAAGGVDQWNVELDGPNPCVACQEAADNGPYDTGDGPDLPIHAMCECESAPVTDSSESRSWSGYHNRRTAMSEKYDADALKDLAAKGKAMKNDDGSISYPIADAEDLSKAIKAVGRGNADHDSIRLHIIEQAAKLGLSDQIPDNWDKTDGSLTDQKSADVNSEDRKDCPTCNGDGKIKGNTTKCPDCDGTGKRAARRPRARREMALQHEMRRFHTNEIRAGKQTDDGLVPLEGVVIRYGVPYEVNDMAGTFTETIHRGAATNVLAGKPDIRMLFNHDGMPLARTGANASLDAWEEDDGLHIRAMVDPRQTIANDLIVALERGTVTQMSVGMQVDREQDQWSGEDEYGLPNVRNIFGLDNIFDASAVTYPASTTTTLALASRMNDMPPEITVRTQKLWELAREGRKGTISQADSDTLMHVIEGLHAVRSSGPMTPDDVRESLGLMPLDDAEKADLIERTLDLLSEVRASPTAQDPIIAKKIADAHVAVAAALAAQAKDPDNNSDPVDKKVWNHLALAHGSLTDAMKAQASDGAPDDNSVEDSSGGPDGTLNGSGPAGGVGSQDGTGARSLVIDIDMDMARLRRRPFLTHSQ